MTFRIAAAIALFALTITAGCTKDDTPSGIACPAAYRAARDSEMPEPADMQVWLAANCA